MPSRFKWTITAAMAVVVFFSAASSAVRAFDALPPQQFEISDVTQPGDAVLLCAGGLLDEAGAHAVNIGIGAFDIDLAPGAKPVDVTLPRSATTWVRRALSLLGPRVIPVSQTDPDELSGHYLAQPNGKTYTLPAKRVAVGLWLRGRITVVPDVAVQGEAELAGIGSNGRLSVISVTAQAWLERADGRQYGTPVTLHARLIEV